ncbi:hypothetical protein [Rhodococcoides kyotonense]|uniref:Uncharacterized protein n=1 Tax=Rhodococcoides kyotonense TaxID=398843 RepID=A0A239LBB9_9NOCA|nr:hypothetical protein [Rhodococcus kyotonensis]SNT26939.1 hypothetical protein SAMN05421642_112129 [Rhodococcus kyotonensis]
MSIPLTLGVPHRPDPNALVTGLFQQRYPGVAAVEKAISAGPVVVPASVLLGLDDGVDLGRVVVELDVDPDDLRNVRAAYEAVRYSVHVDADTLADALVLRLPSPLVIFPELDDSSALETVTAIVDAHRTPGISAWLSPRHIADVLAVVAHSEVGFTARARSGAEAIAVVAATVAALRGDDIPTALASPDVAALAALRPEAADAVRTVLLGIEVDDASAGHRALVEAGLVSADSLGT